MTKATLVGLALSMSAGIASAQPAKQPAPTPVPGPTAIPQKKELPKTDEKAGSDESLQHGAQDSRPWAVGVAPDKQAAALTRFQAGNRELNKGLFENAVKEYRAALKDWEHPAIHYNLALALLKLVRPLEVYDSLNKAIAYGPAPLEKDKYEHAQEYLTLVSQQIANIEITCKKPGAKISLDGKEVFTVNDQGTNGFYKTRTLVGPHTFVAEKPGFNAEVEAPYIGPGEPYRIELKLYTAEELTRYKRKWEKNTWVPYAVIGGGVVLAGAGVAMSLSASSSYDDFDAAVARCNEESGGAGCDADQVKDMRDSGDTKKTLSYVGYGLAGAAVIAGVTLLYVNREQSYQITADQYKKELRDAKKGQQVQLTPMLAPDVAGAMFTGSF